MTTYQDRRLIRNELVTLFGATGAWVNVYGYYPAADVIVNTSPILLVADGGTRQTQAGMHTNPTAHRFVLTTFVLAYDEASDWTSEDAMNKLADLDRVVRQTIRDNVQLTNADNIELDGGFSQIDSVVLSGGVPYLTESRTVTAYLHRGAV
jgi:hypothetical protein